MATLAITNDFDVSLESPTPVIRTCFMGLIQFQSDLLVTIVKTRPLGSQIE